MTEMPCSKLTSLTGCNTCSFYVNDTKLLRTIRSEAIARVCLYLTKNDIISERIIDYNNIVVSCSGIITFNEKTTDVTDTYTIFKQNVSTCGKIINKWCKEHSSELDTLVGCTMMNVDANIHSLSNMYSLREYFIQLVKYLRNLTLCDKMCETVTINKTVSNCIFKLGERKDLIKLGDPIVVLDALSQAIYAYRVSSVERAYIDISCIQIRCDGSIILPSKYIYTDNPLSHLIRNCVEILSRWIGRHQYSRTTIYILDVIDACKIAKDAKDLYMYLQRGIGCIEGFIFFDD